MADDDPLDKVIEEAQEKSDEAKQTIKEAEHKLEKEIDEMLEDNLIEGPKAKKLRDQVNQFEFEEVRDEIEKIKEKNKLDFEDEEKDQFAEAFKSNFIQLTDTMQEMKESLEDLENGTDRSDLVSYLRGKKSKRTKKEVTQVFDAIDSMKGSNISTKDLARALSGFKSDLTMTQAEKMLDEIKEKVNE